MAGGPLTERPAGTWNDAQLGWELANGQRWIVFVDDTGTEPGRPAGVAVTVYPDVGGALMHWIWNRCQLLREETGTVEHHFSPLFQGRPPFDRYTEAERHAILREFVFTFTHHQLPVIVAQDEPGNAHLRERVREVFKKVLAPPAVGEMMGSPMYVMFGALLGALDLRDDDRPLTAVFDAVGKRRSGDLVLGNRNHGPTFTELDPPALLVRSPDDVLPLQLADFAAWAYNRLSQLHERLPLTSWRDKAVLEILQPMVANFVLGAPLPAFR